MNNNGLSVDGIRFSSDFGEYPSWEILFLFGEK